MQIDSVSAHNTAVAQTALHKAWVRLADGRRAAQVLLAHAASVSTTAVADAADATMHKITGNSNDSSSHLELVAIGEAEQQKLAKMAMNALLALLDTDDNTADVGDRRKGQQVRSKEVRYQGVHRSASSRAHAS